MRRLLSLFICIILDVVLLHILDTYKDNPFVQKFQRVVNIIGTLIFVILSILMIIMMIKFL